MRAFGHSALAALMTLGVVAAVGCGGDDETCQGPDGPLASGQTYVDECNACTCNDDGSISCTEKQDCAACTYEGQDYAVGDSWPKGDGCNFCQCLAFDDVSCTDAACTN